ncbi:hypothetical protein V1478_001899 [Vespula squamosa]|uniref:Uncharacterized protein n=1 Tax=Vespula squamosa TaxID=30214 RepID=A0ABD2BYF7_VESSQ
MCVSVDRSIDNTVKEQIWVLKPLNIRHYSSSLRIKQFEISKISKFPIQLYKINLFVKFFNSIRIELSWSYR